MIIRPRENRGGSISYQLDYGMVPVGDGSGKKKRKLVSFEKESDAIAAMRRAEAAQQSLGLMGLQATPLEMAQFMAVKARLPEGTSILEATEFFMREGAKVTKPMLVPEMVERFIWSRVELQRGKRTIETYRTVLRAFAREFPMTKAHELQRDKVRAWLRSQGWQGSTQNKAVGHLRGLFRWARNERHMAADPTEGIEEVSVVLEEIEDLSARQAEALLMTALKVPRFMFYVCLGLFRGMRRSEMEQLKFEELDFETGDVIAAAKKVKTRRRRVIELPEIAKEWIQAAGWTAEMMREGPVAPSNLKRHWPKFWKAAGLTEWPHNGLRHTMASMHYAKYRDERLLQSILGQRSADVFHSNYKALRTPREAEVFWALRPPATWKPLVWTLRDPVFKFVS